MTATRPPGFPELREGDGDAAALAHGIPGGILLRAAIASDLPYLRQLYADMREAEMAQVPWPPAAKRAFLDQQFALQHAHYVRHFPGASFMVLQCRAAQVGRYYLLRDSDFLIIDISLDPQIQGQGVGRALIKRTQALAASLGRGVRLSVRLDNVEARRLYERLGFRRGAVDEHATHLSMRWEPLAGTAPDGL
ncbi:GNAT family N-acetyltransferase [Lysobacter sp. D1-1-M9]|uniref:GNAT family N-acetyltransferase n=1 Tax=Novilysobacter longmucuonensis TaxID=3098603 RepID=UPI002FC5CEEB